MAVSVLVVGNDLNTHKLLIDIIEITFNDVLMEKSINFKDMYAKLDVKKDGYNLLVMDCRNGKYDTEDLIKNIKSSFPKQLEKTIILLDSYEDKPDAEIIGNIPIVIKPFSLDEFGELLNKIHNGQ